MRGFWLTPRFISVNGSGPSAALREGLRGPGGAAGGGAAGAGRVGASDRGGCRGGCPGGGAGTGFNSERARREQRLAWARLCSEHRRKQG